MRTLLLDFETFYGPVLDDRFPQEFTKAGKPKKRKTLNLSLKNKELNYTDYVRHPEFEVLGAALRWKDEPKTTFYRGHELKAVFAKIDWANTKVVAHNVMFEGIILFEIFDIVPAMYFCTMACAEALFQKSVSVGLGELAQLFGIGQKKNELHKFKGLHAKDLSEEQWAALADYCEHDINLTLPLYDALAPALPPLEHEVMNHTLMMWASPRLRIDIAMAREGLEDAKRESAELVAKTGLTADDIRSPIKFAAALKARLGWVPQKINKDGKTKPAFARTDREFVALKGHPDEKVRDLVAARQEVMSPLIITRATRMIKIAETGTRLLPVGLHYARAHTMRWTGGNKLNLQNLPRGSKLRRAIICPPGYVLLVVDSSQIECRTLAWVARQDDLLQMFLNGEDPYNHMAMKVFGAGPYDNKSDERFMGKTMVLGLGYGMGHRKFWLEIVTGARGKAMPITLEFADRAVKIYRDTNNKIMDFVWNQSADMIDYLTHGKEPREFLDGMLTLQPAAGKVIFPNGTFLRYAALACEDGEYSYQVVEKGKTKRKKIYGGLFTENLSQKIARDVVASQSNEVAKRYRWVMTTHDEGGFLVPEKEAEEAKSFALEMFRRNLAYTNIPLDAKADYDVCYSK